MSDSDPGIALLSALSGESVCSGKLRAFQELAYTASERGIIPFKLNPEDSETLIRLVGLADKFRDGLPERFCM